MKEKREKRSVVRGWGRFKYGRLWETYLAVLPLFPRLAVVDVRAVRFTRSQ